MHPNPSVILIGTVVTALPGLPVTSAWIHGVSLSATKALGLLPTTRRRLFTAQQPQRQKEVSSSYHASFPLYGLASGDDTSSKAEDPFRQPESLASNDVLLVPAINDTMLDVDDLWSATFDAGYYSSNNQQDGYRSRLLASSDQWELFWESLEQRTSETSTHSMEASNGSNEAKHRQQIDPFWEQIKLEAETALRSEPQAGPQLYQAILSQPTLLSAICTVVSHEIETELIPATTLKNLFMDLLLQHTTPGSNKGSSSSDSSKASPVGRNRPSATPSIVPHTNSMRYSPSYQEYCIRQDLQAVAYRDPSVVHAMNAILFHNGFHALVCYRVGHLLWQANRTALAYYMQSAVSRIYSADIHPACTMGSGIYLRVGAGVVIGETAVVDDDVSILEGVTLGGTGKEAGDRHPKVGRGVILQDGAAVLGNIKVGEGAVVTAKSIVTKPVPPLAIVSGVPAIVVSERNVQLAESEWDDMERSLIPKYQTQWKILHDDLHTLNTQ